MPTQRYSGKTVLQAARERVSLVFDLFEDVIVSVSGGKDSTVLAHLALKEANRRDRRVGIFFLDEEVVYQSTIDQVEYLMGLYPQNTKRLWLQVPFYLTNATSLTESQLVCWEPGRHKDWMRPKGDLAHNITAKPWGPDREVRSKPVGNGEHVLGFYGALKSFENCYSNTAFMVGLRAAESPNRWLTVSKNPVRVKDRTLYWGTRKGTNTALYPLYDWNFHDVWRYLHDEGIRYSKIYDYQFKKGFSLAEVRVSSLIHEQSFKAICELPEFEPKTYAKLCKRIKGIAFAQETGSNRKVFRCQKLPDKFKSWVTYRDFLLDTHPVERHREMFRNRFAKHLTNEYVARQQCRQLVLNDYENNLPVDNSPDPRQALIDYYLEVL